MNIRVTGDIFIRTSHIVIFNVLMRSISSLLTWVVLVTSLLMNTLQTSCTTLASINLNLLDAQRKMNDIKGRNTTKIFYSSSACMYPEYAQEETNNPGLKEDDAYPAQPDSEYGWEKLFSERLYFAYNRNYGIPVRVARYHNIYARRNLGRRKEKAPAAICRKVTECGAEGTIDVWGDGQQTRSFLYIDECIGFSLAV